jgi:hypothetical protein
MVGVSGLFRRRGDMRPIFHLNAGDELVAAIRRAEDRGFTFFHVESVLAERSDNIWLVRDENRVGVSLRRCGEHLSKCLGAPVSATSLFSAPASAMVGFLRKVVFA